MFGVNERTMADLSHSDVTFSSSIRHQRRQQDAETTALHKGAVKSSPVKCNERHTVSRQRHLVMTRLLCATTVNKLKFPFTMPWHRRYSIRRSSYTSLILSKKPVFISNF